MNRLFLARLWLDRRLDCAGLRTLPTLMGTCVLTLLNFVSGIYLAKVGDVSGVCCKS
jgi:hypothetical protein